MPRLDPHVSQYSKMSFLQGRMKALLPFEIGATRDRRSKGSDIGSRR